MKARRTMWVCTKNRSKLVAALLGGFVSLMTGLSLSGEVKPTAGSKTASSYQLTVEDSLVTLRATDARLSEVLETLSEQTGIEIITDISDQDKISVEFSALPMKEAVRRLSTNTVYEWSATAEGEAFDRIYVLRAGSDKAPVTADPIDERASPQEGRTNKPFEFEFDPTAHQDKIE